MLNIIPISIIERLPFFTNEQPGHKSQLDIPNMIINKDRDRERAAHAVSDRSADRSTYRPSYCR
jgi:hypothetical protein